MITRIFSKDYPRLMQIWENAVLGTHDFLQPEDFVYYKKHLHSYFEHVKLYGLLDPEGQILGFMGVHENQLEMLFVDNVCRRMGVGRPLLEYAIEKFGVEKVSVNEQNTQAVKFYSHLGFIVESRQEMDDQGKPYPILHMTNQSKKHLKGPF
ncbi:GNAT family N-acetyltransferase [Myroides sp. LJL115]